MSSKSKFRKVEFTDDIIPDIQENTIVDTSETDPYISADKSENNILPKPRTSKPIVKPKRTVTLKFNLSLGASVIGRVIKRNEVITFSTDDILENPLVSYYITNGSIEEITE